MATVDVYSRRICDQSLALIKSVYENVHTMPYGLRWICKTLSDLIYTQNPDISIFDRNSMIGTLLFYKWWLPSILSAHMNGLLSDTVISDSARKNISFICNVVKHIIRNDYFSEPQYDKINAFISS